MTTFPRDVETHPGAMIQSAECPFVKRSGQTEWRALWFTGCYLLRPRADVKVRHSYVGAFGEEFCRRSPMNASAPSLAPASDGNPRFWAGAERGAPATACKPRGAAKDVSREDLGKEVVSERPTTNWPTSRPNQAARCARVQGDALTLIVRVMSLGKSPTGVWKVPP